jgi:hypothetical protein
MAQTGCSVCVLDLNLKKKAQVRIDHGRERWRGRTTWERCDEGRTNEDRITGEPNTQDRADRMLSDLVPT